ncbi:SAM-dependent methyltransferase [Spirillospora sp. NPDC050679]
MKLSLIGDLEIEDDQGRLVAFEEGKRRQRRVRFLVAVLACRDWAPTSQQIKVLLWPEDDQDRTSALTSLIHKARKLLPEGRLVTEPAAAGGRRYRLRRPGDVVDIEDFVKLTALGSDARDEGLLEEAAEHYALALEPWQGVADRDAFPDLPDVAELKTLRDSLLALRLRAAEASVAVQLDLGRHTPRLVEQIAGHLLIDPTNEVMASHRMLALHRLGRRAEALRAYDEIAAVLDAELGATPGTLLQQMRTKVQHNAADLQWQAPRKPVPVPAGLSLSAHLSGPGTRADPDPAEPDTDHLHAADFISNTAGVVEFVSDAVDVPVRGEVTAAGVTDILMGNRNSTLAERIWLEEFLSTVNTDSLALPRENRACLERMVREIARNGVEQFLDLGSGFPEEYGPHVHEMARRVTFRMPRVLYVDISPLVETHSHAFMVDGVNTKVLQADMQDVDQVLTAARRHLDFTKPIALLAFNSLQYIGPSDADRGTGHVLDMVARYVAALPNGSCWAMTHITDDGLDPELRPAIDMRIPGAPLAQHLRTMEQIESLFLGMGLVKPGLTDVGRWRPEQEHIPRGMRILAGLAWKRADPGRADQ